MVKALTQSSDDYLDRQMVPMTFTINVDGSPLSKNHIMEYNYGFDTSFGSARASVSLANPAGVYSEGNSPAFGFGSTIEIIEGIASDSFTRFEGIIRQVTPSKRKGGGNFLEITAYDNIVRLGDMEIDKTFEASKTAVDAADADGRLTPDMTSVAADDGVAFYGLINGTPSGDTLNYDGDLNESNLLVGDLVYNANKKESKKVQSINTATNEVVFEESVASWSNDDAITNKAHFAIWNFPQSPVATKPLPTFKIVRLDNALQEPVWDGFEINYQNGQLILGRGLSAHDYKLIASYSYYSAGINVETIIEQIITEADTYGYSFTSSDIQDNFTAVEGGSTDTMTPNYATVTIDGVDYPAGKVWYLTFNRVVTSLVAGNFTVPGASIDTVDLTNGRILLDTAISIASTVTCDINYTFNTIQATGIATPYVSFKSRDTKTRFDAINALRELLAPNYIIYTHNGKIWGKYLNQKFVEDYELKLMSNINYFQDSDIYSRVKVFGKNINPENLVWKEGVAFVDQDIDYKASATNTQLTKSSEKEEEGKSFYKPGNPVKILSTPAPIVYVNGIPIDNQVHEIITAAVVVRKTTTVHTPSHHWYHRHSPVWTYNYQIVLSHSGIVNAGGAISNSITFYEADGTVVPISDHLYPYTMDFSGGILSVSYNLDLVGLETISTATYKINYADGVEVVDDRSGFWIKNNILSRLRDDVISATFEYEGMIPAFEKGGDAFDGRGDTQVQLEFLAQPTQGLIIAILDLGQVQRVDAIDITAGYFLPNEYEGDRRRFNCINSYTLEYDPGDNVGSITSSSVADPTVIVAPSHGRTTGDILSIYGHVGSTPDINGSHTITVTGSNTYTIPVDVTVGGAGGKWVKHTWFLLSGKASNFRLGSGETVSFDTKDMGEDFKSRYFKFILETSEKVSYLEGRWIVSFADISIYKNTIVVGEARLIPLQDTGTGTSSTNKMTDTTKSWSVNEHQNSYMVDVYGEEFTITANGTDYLDLDGTPTDGEYFIFEQLDEPALVDDRNVEYVYDKKGLLAKTKDIIYKETNINDFLETETEVNHRAKGLLKEFYKNHEKASVQILYDPHIFIGHTVKINDSTNSVSKRFFVEGVNGATQGKGISVNLGHYPA